MTRGRREAIVAATAFAMLGAAACDGCHDPETTQVAPPQQALPEAWTMGVAGDQELTLPPPCTLRAELLRTVLPRETRIASERATLGQLLVAEGAVLPRWKLDASGLIQMKLGLTRVLPAPWPDGTETPTLARSGEHWLTLLPRAASLDVWRGGQVEATGLRATPADVHCNDELCAIVGVEVRASPADGATVLVGAAGRPLREWERAHIEPLSEGGTVQSVQSLSANHEDWSLDLTFASATRVTFVHATSAARETVASLTLPGELAASLAGTEQRVPMAASVMGDASSCAAEHGGLVLTRPDRDTLALRSALRASQVRLLPLNGGALATWLSPVRCESSLTLLSAAVLRNDGELVGTVSSVADATRYAVASRGDEADLWLRDGNRLTWARMRCALPTTKPPTTNP